MQATRVIKRIQNTQLGELTSYIGQQVEIIIWPIPDDVMSASDNEHTRHQQQFSELLERCSGTVAPWTREELHER